MKVPFIWVRNAAEQVIRKAYTLWLLNRATIGKKVRIHFPIEMQGRGRVRFGDGMIVHRNVILGCAAGSEIKFGKRCVVSEAAYLCTSYAGKIHCGDDCSIGPFVKLFAHNLCEIGAGSHIESYCSIFAREHGLDGTLKVGRGCHIGDNSIVDLSGSVVLGDNVAVGPYSIIYTHDHDYQADSPAAWAGATLLGPVEIGDGAWVGSRVTILSGVKIGARAVVAAGAVVTKDVPPGVVVGGVPARPIKAQS